MSEIHPYRSNYFGKQTKKERKERYIPQEGMVKSRRKMCFRWSIFLILFEIHRQEPRPGFRQPSLL